MRYQIRKFDADGQEVSIKTVAVKSAEVPKAIRTLLATNLHPSTVAVEVHYSDATSREYERVSDND